MRPLSSSADVHGCAAELDTLLVKSRGGRYRLTGVGDLVARGPDGIGVLRLLAKHGALWFWATTIASCAGRPKPGQKLPETIPSSVANVLDKLEERDWH